MGAAHAADLGAALLGGDPGGGVHGVVVGEAAQHLARVDRLLPVQGEEVLAPRLEPLQVVHPVGDRGAAGRLGRRGGSSSSTRRRAGAASARRRCGAPPRSAGRGSRRGLRAPPRSGRPSMRQRLVGVGGDDDAVEALGLAAVGLDPHLVREPLDPPHRRRGAHPVAPRRDDRLDVGARAALDRPPAAAGRAGCTCRGCRRTRP